MTNQVENKVVSKTSGRKILLGMAVIFVLPFTIAATLHLLNVHPSSRSYGTLVNPPKPLEFSALHDAKGNAIESKQWLKKWSIVTIEAGTCAEQCQAQIHLLKQVNIAMDKDAKRVQRVLIAPNAETFDALQKQYPDLMIVSGADAATTQFAAQFNGAAGSIYLVDPLGNLMMRYPQNLNPKGMLTDLKKLLKNSWAG
jgi:cytochrome oxidase Cu insertion factor (SCO1/SenC/PrrC family)